MGSNKLTRKQSFAIRTALGTQDTSKMSYTQISNFIKEVTGVELLSTAAMAALLDDMEKPRPLRKGSKSKSKISGRLNDIQKQIDGLKGLVEALASKIVPVPPNTPGDRGY